MNEGRTILTGIEAIDGTITFTYDPKLRKQMSGSGYFEAIGMDKFFRFYHQFLPPVRAGTITAETTNRAWSALCDIWEATEYRIGLPTRLTYGNDGEILLEWDCRHENHYLSVEADRNEPVNITYRCRETDKYVGEFILAGERGLPDEILNVLPFFTTQTAEDANV